MENNPLTALAERYSVAWRNRDSREWKSELLRALLIRKAKQKPDEAAMINIAINGLSALSECDIDRALVQEAYNQHPKEFDPPSKKRRPEAAIRRYGKIKRVKKENERYRWSDEKAAKHVHPEWRQTYSKPEHLARRYFDDCQMVDRLEAERAERRPELLAALVSTYAHDKTAMRIWSAFCEYALMHVVACEYGDIQRMLLAAYRLRKVSECPHPFVKELNWIYAPVSAVYMRLSALFERLDDPVLRRQTLAGSRYAEASISEVTEMLVEALRVRHLMQPKQIKRR